MNNSSPARFRVPSYASLLLLLGFTCATLRAAFLDMANPDFEYGHDSVTQWGAPGANTYVISNWGTVTGSGSPVFTWVTGSPGNEVHSGRRAVSIGNVPINTVNNRWVQLAANTVPVSSGQQLVVSAWIKGSSGNWDLAHDGYRYIVEYFDSSGAALSSATWLSSSSTNLLSSTSWTLYSHTTDPAPSTAAKAKLSLVFGRTASTSTAPVITFDDVRMFLSGSSTNAAYPEPAASWTSTDTTAQYTAGQTLLTALAGLSNGTSGSPTNYTIAPGDYRFDEASAFVLADKSYLNLTATGVRFWIVPFKSTTASFVPGINLLRCHHVTINGVTIDYTITPFSQGRISSIDTSTGAITMLLDPGFTAPTFLVNNTLPAIATGGKIILFNEDGDLLRTTLDWVSSSGVRDNGDGTYTFTPIAGLTMYGGQTLTSFKRVALASRRWRHAVNLDRSSSCSLTNITVYASPQMGFGEAFGLVGSPSLTSNTYTNCKVIPRPNTERLLSSNADAFHSTGMNVGPKVQGCELASAGDDLMNIHGMIAYVNSSSATALTLVTQLFGDTDAGSVAFYTQPLLKPKYSSNPDFTTSAISAITTTTDTTLQAANTSMPANGLGTFFLNFPGYPNAPLALMTLSSTPSSLWQGDIAMKRSHIGEGTRVEYSYFHDAFAHGIILNSGNSSITHNLISNIGMGSIRLAPDIHFMEGPYSRDVAITYNTIERNGWASLWMGNAGNPLIAAITVTGEASFGTRSNPASAEHKSIDISYNTITEPTTCAIFMSDVTGGTITHNTITDAYRFGRSTDTTLGVDSKGAGWKKLNFQGPPDYALVLANSDTITISSNSIGSSLTTPAGVYKEYGWHTSITSQYTSP